MIASLLFTIPVAGLAVGVAAGAIAGKKSDVGIDDMRLNTSVRRRSIRFLSMAR